MKPELILLLACISSIKAQYNLGRTCGASEANEDCDNLEQLLKVSVTKNLNEKELVLHLKKLGDVMSNMICEHETLATYQYTKDRYELIWNDIYRVFVELFLKLLKNRLWTVENKLQTKVGEIMDWYKRTIENLEASRALLETRGVKSAVISDIRFMDICTNAFFMFLNSYGEIASAFLT